MNEGISLIMDFDRVKTFWFEKHFVMLVASTHPSIIPTNASLVLAISLLSLHNSEDFSKIIIESLDAFALYFGIGVLKAVDFLKFEQLTEAFENL